MHFIAILCEIFTIPSLSEYLRKKKPLLSDKNLRFSLRIKDNLMVLNETPSIHPYTHHHLFVLHSGLQGGLQPVPAILG